ncbi:hypothetical protein [Microbacterium sp. JB110]|uniref:hypothetical protein n=1 Tax=Microbacterium sp. JB110 TaxID=2024477 RepID=UPI001482D55A|nr:hypothetical protein [Microbacterium sp. JB110]
MSSSSVALGQHMPATVFQLHTIPLTRRRTCESQGPEPERPNPPCTAGDSAPDPAPHGHRSGAGRSIALCLNPFREEELLGWLIERPRTGVHGVRRDVDDAVPSVGSDSNIDGDEDKATGTVTQYTLDVPHGASKPRKRVAISSDRSAGVKTQRNAHGEPGASVVKREERRTPEETPARHGALVVGNREFQGIMCEHLGVKNACCVVGASDVHPDDRVIRRVVRKKPRTLGAVDDHAPSAAADLDERFSQFVAGDGATTQEKSPARVGLENDSRPPIPAQRHDAHVPTEVHDLHDSRHVCAHVLGELPQAHDGEPLRVLSGSGEHAVAVFHETGQFGHNPTGDHAIAEPEATRVQGVQIVELTAAEYGALRMTCAAAQVTEIMAHLKPGRGWRRSPTNVTLRERSDDYTLCAGNDLSQVSYSPGRLQMKHTVHAGAISKHSVTRRRPAHIGTFRPKTARISARCRSESPRGIRHRR